MPDSLVEGRAEHLDEGSVAGARSPIPEVRGDRDPMVRGRGRPSSSWWITTSSIAVAISFGLGLLAAIWLLAAPLALLILGITLAQAMLPLVRWLERRMPRTAAVLLVYLVIAVAVAGIAGAIIPVAVAQITQVVENAPMYIDQAEAWLQARSLGADSRIEDLLLSSIGSIGSTLVALPTTVFSSLLDIVLIVFVSIYWLVLLPGIERFFLSLFAEEQRGRAGQVAEDIGSAMGGYMRGVAINSVIVGVLTYVGLLIIGVDYAVILSLITALLEVIPILGPWIAGAIVVVVALLQSPTTALIAAIFILVLQQVESNILVPNIMHAQSDVSPLLVIIALFAGGAIGGLLGAVVAIPIAAALQVLVVEVVAPFVRRRTGAGPNEQAEQSGGEA